MKFLNYSLIRLLGASLTLLLGTVPTTFGGTNTGGRDIVLDYKKSIFYCKNVLNQLDQYYRRAMSTASVERREGLLFKGLDEAISLDTQNVSYNTLLQNALKRGKEFYQRLDALSKPDPMSGLPPLPPQVRLTAKFFYYSLLDGIAKIDSHITQMKHNPSEQRKLFEFRHLAYSKYQIQWLLHYFVAYRHNHLDWVPQYGLTTFMNLAELVAKGALEDLSLIESTIDAFEECPFVTIKAIFEEVAKFNVGDHGHWGADNPVVAIANATNYYTKTFRSLVPSLEPPGNVCQFPKTEYDAMFFPQNIINN